MLVHDAGDQVSISDLAPGNRDVIQPEMSQRSNSGAEESSQMDGVNISKSFELSAENGGSREMHQFDGGGIHSGK